ncbi:hypothetical protein E3O42_16295 [Cryobacterium adonitolivorans]|uniref:Uncharacterized protein n=1 Tax=Cryobacterium adonitolivorans TaxID=1259189 RepID=A0A4R8W1L5_9MICO|nr:hypothetical protein [Cryobacterium adonitolivorans]TFB97496.1 hypothetical protein E3O42_16295 [Cryobacterium adonitolivorans]
MLLLGGCAGSSSEPPVAGHAQSTTPATTSSTPALSPTPTAPNLDDPASWVIGFTSIGPLTVGSELSEAAQVMTSFTSTVYDGCPSVVAYGRTGFPTVLVPDRLGTGIVEQVVLQGGADAAGLSVNSPHTEAGIGIGSTLDELMAAYPAITYQDDALTPHYALPDDGANWINFSMSEGVVRDIVVRASPVVAKEYCG